MPLILITPVKDGRISKSAEEAIQTALEQANGKTIEITIKGVRSTRSLKQNAFFHGFILPPVWDHLFVRKGNVFSLDDVKEFLKKDIGNLYKNIITPDGQIVQIPRSTTELTPKEFEDWLEAIRQWAAEYGLILPYPGENLIVEYSDNVKFINKEN